jgi:hypothetical protein
VAGDEFAQPFDFGDAGLDRGVDRGDIALDEHGIQRNDYSSDTIPLHAPVTISNSGRSSIVQVLTKSHGVLPLV